MFELRVFTRHWVSVKRRKRLSSGRVYIFLLGEAAGGEGGERERIRYIHCSIVKTPAVG